MTGVDATPCQGPIPQILPVAATIFVRPLLSLIDTGEYVVAPNNFRVDVIEDGQAKQKSFELPLHCLVHSFHPLQALELNKQWKSSPLTFARSAPARMYWHKTPGLPKRMTLLQASSQYLRLCSFSIGEVYVGTTLLQDTAEGSA